MRILVTGAAGHLGRALRQALETRTSHRVVYWVSPNSSTSAGAQRVDLRDFESVEQMVHAVRPDAIVHLAAVAGTACDSDPQNARRVNIDATAHLAATAARIGTERFVFASTSAVYGDQYTMPVSEDAPTPAPSLYARTKLAAEVALAAVADQSDLKTTSLRIFNIYGPGFEGSLVERLRSSTAQHPVALRGLDQFVRDYVHVDDVVRTLICAVERDLTGTTTINVGSGVPTSNRKLVARFPASAIHYVVTDGPYSYSCACTHRAQTALGYTARERL